MEMKILFFSISQGGICWVRSGIEARESLCPCPLQRGGRGREEKGGNCRKSQVSWIFSIFNRPWNLLRSCLCFWCRVFCVFRNLQKLILFGQKSAFCCRYTVHRGSGKNIFMLLTSRLLQSDKSSPEKQIYVSQSRTLCQFGKSLEI